MENYFDTQIAFGTAYVAISPDLQMWISDKAALHRAIEVGYKVFDAAEMYGITGRDGRSEKMLGEVLKESGKRDQLHIVSKVLPFNATDKKTIVSCCQNSIKRLQCDYIDTYMLHWRQPQNLELGHVVEAFHELQTAGLIKKFGVSNFDIESMEEWKTFEEELGADSFVTNQIHYSLATKTSERYLDWHRDNNITIMSYSPLNNNRNNILSNRNYLNIAQQHGYEPAQLALAWVMKRPEVIAITSSTNNKRIENNFLATQIKLTPEVISDLNKLFFRGI